MCTFLKMLQIIFFISLMERMQFTCTLINACINHENMANYGNAISMVDGKYWQCQYWGKQQIIAMQQKELKLF